jgi:outer membrane protein assembly factor BamB
MKAIFKLFWLLVPLLALNACKKNRNEVKVTELNKTVIVSDNTSNLYAVNAATGVAQWNYAPANGGGTYYSTPAVSKSYAIYHDDGNSKLYCVNMITGALIWTVDGIDGYRGSPLLSGDVVYASASGRIKALKISDGTLVEEIMVPQGYSPNSLNLVNDIFVVATCGGHMYGINTSGTVLWSYESSSGCYHNNPAIVDGVIYILSSNGKLSAVNVTTGAEIWTKTYSYETMGNTSVVYNNGQLFVNGSYYSSNRIYAINANTGDVVHQYNLPSGEALNYYYSAPAVKDGILYTLTNNGLLLAYSVANENIIWQTSYAPVTGGIAGRSRTGLHNRVEDSYTNTSVVIANNMLFFGYEKNMYATDMSGIQKWKFTASDYIYSAPVILSTFDKVYHSGTSGVVQ